MFKKVKEITKKQSFEYTYLTLLCVLSFCLPLNQKISTLLLLLVVMFSLIRVFRFKEGIFFENRYIFIPALLYIIIGFSIFYSQNTGVKYLEQRASFIAIPLIFTTIKTKKELYEKILKAFVYGCLLAVILCYINAFYASFQFINGKILFQPVVNEEFSFFYSVVRDGNYFFSSFFSIFHDTIYFGIYLNMAIAIILAFSLWRNSNWYFLLLFIFSVVVFQLSSKIGLITCFLNFLIYLLFRIKHKSLKAGLCFLILIIGFSFFFFNPRGKSMMEKFEREGLFINPEERFGYTLRLMSWDAAIELIKENPIFGAGVGDSQLELNQKYEMKGYDTPLKNKFNGHNQFFQIYLECGILGLILLVLMLYELSKTVSYNDKKTFLNLAFLLIIVLGFLFESVLNRYSGIAFFMFFYSILLNKNINKINE